MKGDTVYLIPLLIAVAASYVAFDWAMEGSKVEYKYKDTYGYTGDEAEKAHEGKLMSNNNAYHSANEAAEAGLNSVYKKSMQIKTEAGGCIHKTKNGYVYDSVTWGQATQVTIRCDKNNLAGGFHTHPESRWPFIVNLTEQFSDGSNSDISSADHNFRTMKSYEGAYLGTAGGKILKYDGSSVTQTGSIS